MKGGEGEYTKRGSIKRNWRKNERKKGGKKNCL
jgi:hypothetical protein